jgi:ubiquinone/menaquinone biosynthesis C-methylase UbiE
VRLDSDDYQLSQEELAECMDWTAFHDALLDAARLAPGERVLDVGCGFGETTMAAAARVAPGGFVVGLDSSPEMLSRAERRLAATGMNNVELVRADAQTHRLERGSFDVVISAFGLMFFDDPDVAFGNFRPAMRSGGWLAFVSWQQLSNAEWFVVATEAMSGYVGLPSITPATGCGPFSFSDREWVEHFLQAHGFVDISTRAVTRPERVGRTIDEAARVIASLPAVHPLLAGASGPAAADAVSAMKAALQPYTGPDGVVSDATVWLVTAAAEG